MRWRTDKKKRKRTSVAPNVHVEPSIAPFTKRLKAFVIDSFMLLMPILYVVFYLVYGSREGFATHMFQGWMIILLAYGFATLLFLSKTAQTPGYKAYDLHLINLHSDKRISFSQLLMRYSVMILTTFSVIGLFIPLMRKDKLALYDIFSRTAPICK